MTAPTTSGPTWDRLEDQLGWYDRASGGAQCAYKQLKLLQLILAGAGPYVDPSSATRTLAERLEGLISQEHAQWVSAREEPSTANASGA